MRSLSVQVQPHLSPGIPMAKVTEAFEAVAAGEDVTTHSFQSGTDQEQYFNYTFDTNALGQLWTRVRKEIYNDTELGLHLRRASIAMCTGHYGWDDYLLLFHFDPAVNRDSADAL